MARQKRCGLRFCRGISHDEANKTIFLYRRPASTRPRLPAQPTELLARKTIGMQLYTVNVWGEHFHRRRGGNFQHVGWTLASVRANRQKLSYLSTFHIQWWSADRAYLLRRPAGNVFAGRLRCSRSVVADSEASAALLQEARLRFDTLAGSGPADSPEDDPSSVV